jgi:hypothetical protein
MEEFVPLDEDDKPRDCRKESEVVNAEYGSDGEHESEGGG